MLTIFNRILLTIFLLATPFLFYGFGRELLKIAAQFSFGQTRWLWFLTGTGAFFPCWFLAKRLILGVWSYLETLEHELTHLLVGLIFLKIPVGIRVSAHAGGEVRQIGRGTTGQIWIALAPYFFPTVSLAVIVAAYFLRLDTFYLLAILGWTTAFHLVSNWAETSFRQPDLQKAGLLSSILILPVMNLICYGAVLSFVAGGRKGFFQFWIDGLRETAGAFLTLLKLIF